MWVQQDIWLTERICAMAGPLVFRQIGDYTLRAALSSIWRWHVGRLVSASVRACFVIPIRVYWMQTSPLDAIT